MFSLATKAVGVIVGEAAMSLLTKLTETRGFSQIYSHEKAQEAPQISPMKGM